VPLVNHSSSGKQAYNNCSIGGQPMSKADGQRGLYFF